MAFKNKLIVTVVSAAIFSGAFPYASAMNEIKEENQIVIKKTQKKDFESDSDSELDFSFGSETELEFKLKSNFDPVPLPKNIYIPRRALIPTRRILVNTLPESYMFPLDLDKGSSMSFEELTEEIHKGANRTVPKVVKGKKIVSIFHENEVLDLFNFADHVAQFKGNNIIYVTFERDEELSRIAIIQDLEEEKEENLENIREMMKRIMRLQRRNKELDINLAKMKQKSKKY